MEAKAAVKNPTNEAPPLVAVFTPPPPVFRVLAVFIVECNSKVAIHHTLVSTWVSHCERVSNEIVDSFNGY